MLDLFSGIGGASQPFVDKGWRVIKVELDERFPADWRDVTNFHPPTSGIDLVWASPPCTEFSRESMPWCKTGVPPSMDLVNETLRIVFEANPRWWIVENVRGAKDYLTPVLGPRIAICGAVNLWGSAPLDTAWPKIEGHKMKYSGREKHLRSAIPYPVGEALEAACSRALARWNPNRRR